MTSKSSPKRQVPAVVRPPSETTLGLSAAAAFACAVFAAAYWLFRWCQPWVIAAHTPSSPADFMPWARWAVMEQDGRELPIAFVGLVACLCVCFEVTRRGLARRALSSRLVQLVCYGAAALVVLGVRSTEFSYAPLTGLILVAVASLVLAILWRAPRVLAWRWSLALATGACATAAALAFLFTTGDPSINDYGYMIGPALEWMQGEKLGGFYMQYSLLGTIFTGALMRLGLHVNGMQVACAGLALCWFALYWWLAKELIRDRALRVLFFICLVAFRVLWMRCNIAAIPQVAPFRMELWVPLVLVARKQGLSSPWTAGCCAAIYALDALFGFLCVAVYLVSVAFEFKSLARRAELRPSTVLGVLGPVALAGVFNLAVFGSLVASSARHYMDVKLGFLPISSTSLFWAVLLILLLSAVVFARAGNERRFGLFLVSIATVQMTYFLGRSHDHNLVNIGGSWLLVAFVALDVVLLGNPRCAKTAASVLLIAVLGLGSQRIVGALGRSSVRLLHGPWLEEHALDRFLEEKGSELPTNTPTVILMCREDAYLNYRLGLRQHGYISPIYAHVLLEETAGWLHEEMTRGRRVIVPGAGPEDLSALQETVSELNRTRFMTGRSSMIDVKGPVFTFCLELTLAR